MGKERWSKSWSFFENAKLEFQLVKVYAINFQLYDCKVSGNKTTKYSNMLKNIQVNKGVNLYLMIDAIDLIMTVLRLIE